ncbi:MAG: phosphoribosylamine--glycine ligase [Nitrososphaerales archaeon]
MKILGVGSGAREHAIAKKLSLSIYNPKIYWIGENKNPGIVRICMKSGGEFIQGSTTDPEVVSSTAKRFNVDFVFIGPEEPNFHAVPDHLERLKIPCIGANRSVALIEMSKAEMRRLQWEYDIPGKLLFQTFKSAEEAYLVLEKYADSLTWLQNVALKPARQAGGKGVKVVEDRQIYLHEEKQKFKSKHVSWLEGYMRGYGDIEDKILVEENVWGPEYTLQCFTDGTTVLGMPMVQDNKNAHEFDIGTETGGMGSISGPGMCLPFLTMREYEDSIRIIGKMVSAIQDKTGKRYHGVVAGQMMLTEVEGPTIIEMYSRLGDPEALNVLHTLKTDLVEVCLAIIDERLSKIRLEFEDKAVVVKAIAPKGYPDNRSLAIGHPVAVDEAKVSEIGCELFWASCNLHEDGRITTAGSRLVEILAEGETLPVASAQIEKAIPYVKLTDGWGLFHRSDIGSEALLKRREELAERVRRLYLYRVEKGTVGKRVDWLPGVGKVDPVSILKNGLRR